MYFGSVRFFKNLILLAVIILIAVPTAFSFSFYFDIREQKATIASLREQLAEKDKLTEAFSKNEEDLPYQSLYPDFYAPEGYHATDSKDKVIYLTFDDGPSANTDRILDVLKQEGVKATFFVTGRTSETDLQRMKRIVAEGHTIGMHSYSHNYTKIYSSVEAFLDDMYPIFVQIKETTGETPVVFRFPGGSINAYNGDIYQEIIAEMIRRGFVPWDWNISAQDATAKKVTSAQIIANVTGRAAKVNRGVVLMHDSAAKTATAGAVKNMIHQLKDMGFTLDKITPELKPIIFPYKDETVMQ